MSSRTSGCSQPLPWLTSTCLIRGGLDFRTAYLYDLIEIASNDGLPPAYHLLIWSAFFDRLASALR